MDSDLTLEEKCENLMNVVVETRKRFGKMCAEYEQKSSLVENKMLDLQLETIANFKYKPKNAAPVIDVSAMCKDTDDFTAEILERQRKIDRLLGQIKSTQEVVGQFKKDNVGRRLVGPVSAPELLARAKAVNS